MFQDCPGAATGDGVNDFAGRDETSSSEAGVELGIKVNLHTPRYIWCLVWGTCIQIVQVLQSRGSGACTTMWALMEMGWSSLT